MTRSTVFVMYNSDGIVEDYIIYILNNLREYSKYLLVICNNNLEAEDSKRLLGIADDIIIRENKGYDIAAYRDAVLKYIPREIYRNTDELILMNDTVFGPVFPLENIFNQFEDSVDFWGLTRHPEIDVILDDNSTKHIFSHVQSYFIAIRKRMLNSEEFFDYWKNVPDFEDVQAVIDNFEVKFTCHFEKLGFKCNTIMEKNATNDSFSFVDNPYIMHSFELISKNKVPFLKKRAIIASNNLNDDGLNAIDWLIRETSYDVSLISQSLGRSLNKDGGLWGCELYVGLDEFYKMHKDIYIYGAGVVGERYKKYFEFRGWRFKSFLTGRVEDKSENILYIGDVIIGKEAGVVLAVGKRLHDEARAVLRNRVTDFQIYDRVMG